MSVAVVHASEILACVELEACAFVGVEGACVSALGGHALVAAVSVAFVDRLPAASNASTEKVYVLPQLNPFSVYVVEEEEAVEAPPW